MGRADDAKYFSLMAAKNCYEILDSGPTHITATSETRIDLCLSTRMDFVGSFKTSVAPEISRHLALVLEVNVQPPKSAVRTCTYRPLKNYNTRAAANIITSNLLKHAADDNDLTMESLNACLLDALDTLAPQRTFTSKRPPVPWYSKELGHLIKTKKFLFIHFRRTRRNDAYEKYREASRRVKRQLAINRKRAFDKSLAGASDARCKWNVLRDYGVIKKTTSPTPQLSINPDEHASFFAEMGKQSGGDDQSEASPYTPLNTTSQLTDITPSDLRGALKKLKSNAVGLDDIPRWLIIDNYDILEPVLLYIFNNILRSGIVPAVWKKALVAPIPKISSPVLPSDYRPIAMLPVTSKLFEYIVQERILRHCRDRNVLNNEQHGFRPGHSTQTALLTLVDDIQNEMDHQRLTIGAFLDLSKAFDSLDHGVLKTRLIDLDFEPALINLILSYLDGRSLAVKADGNRLSKWVHVRQGVPQGSILGPLLFVIFIAALTDRLHHTKVVMYADDITLFASDSADNYLQLRNNLAHDLESVIDWCRMVKLKLNVQKTQVVLFGTPFYTNSIAQDDKSIVLHGSSISFNTQAKVLGVLLDGGLTFKFQVYATCKKTYSSLARLWKAHKLLSTAQRTSLVKAIVYPHLDYCSLLYIGLTDELREMLQVASNSATRFIALKMPWERISESRVHLKFLTLVYRRYLYLGTLVYKLRKTELPASLHCKLVPRTLVYATRRAVDTADELLIPRASTDIKRKSLSCLAPRMWNLIPTSIKEATTIVKFTSDLFDFLLLLDQYNDTRNIHTLFKE